MVFTIRLNETKGVTPNPTPSPKMKISLSKKKPLMERTESSRESVLPVRFPTTTRRRRSKGCWHVFRYSVKDGGSVLVLKYLLWETPSEFTHAGEGSLSSFHISVFISLGKIVICWKSRHRHLTLMGTKLEWLWK